MNWMEVVEGLRQKKKFRRKDQRAWIQAERNGMIFMVTSPNGIGVRYLPFLDDYEAMDWEEC